MEHGRICSMNRIIKNFLFKSKIFILHFFLPIGLITVSKSLFTVLKPSGTVRYGRVRLGTVGYGQVRSGTVRYGRVRLGTVGYGLETVRYGLENVGYGRVRLVTVLKTLGRVGYGRVRLVTLLKMLGTVGYGWVRFCTVGYCRIRSHIRFVSARYGTCTGTLKYICGYSIDFPYFSIFHCITSEIITKIQSLLVTMTLFQL